MSNLDNLRINPTDHETKRFGPVVSILNAQLLTEIQRRQPLLGALPEPGDSARYRWKYSTLRTAQPTLWRVYVGSGCVNDEIAAMQYLRVNDPRGWQMPANYGPFAKLARVYGPSYPFVDRPLYEVPQPFLLLTAPDAAGQDLGGFEFVTTRPPFFRTAQMWQRDLYRAHVVVSSAPYRADPALIALQTGGAVAQRYRVSAGKLPIQVAGSGVSALDFKELGRIYLTRIPGRPEADQLYIQQLTYWSMQGRSAVPQDLVELIGAIAEAGEGLDLGVLGLGLTGIVTGEALLGIESLIADAFLANLNDLAEDASTSEFWSV